jgi:hypothetical protein
MQANRIVQWFVFLFIVFPFVLQAQVNSVEFGKNRIQHKKFAWKFYQSPNFNTYVAQGGVELGKFVAQVAEEELRSIENFVEYSLQRRANIVVYNSYNDFKSSNIGLGTDWQNAGGITKLVNNKLVVYFDGNHENLKRMIRQGIARVLTDNLLFGDDIGEFASNQALLDLPKWLVDGYVAYAAENWSTEKDDELKSAIMGGSYNNFYQFAFDRQLLAGHAFWRYIGEKYRKENVTYLLYLARIYKNLNNACLRVCKKKFKDLLTDFMAYEQNRYAQDLRQRRNQPRGQMVVSEDVSKKDYFRFQVNPNPRSSTYAAVEFKKGLYTVKLMENFYNAKTLLKLGARTNQGDINPNYPILAWDGKGTRLLVMYWEEGKVKMFVYDILAKYKRFKQEITDFDQVLDASFMVDANTLVLSAVKNGHSDIYTYKIEQQKATQITNDIYDDLDPTFIAFPNRVGIIFASNRPGPAAPKGDTILPGKYPFNIFMVDVLNDSKEKQLAQLTNVKTGNARYPMQYNTNHFTFVSDANGIGNRWAGFFSTQRNGLDTLYYIGDELLRNPSPKDFDSTLRAWQKQEPDSVSYFQVYKDSTYTFPITNYQSSLVETRIAGDKGQVSEVRREGEYKFVYKLRVDSVALAKRNISVRPTEYMRKVLADKKAIDNKAIFYDKKAATDTSKKAADFFQNEFADEKPDTSRKHNATSEITPEKVSTLAKSKLFDYRLKFSSDFVLAGFSNNILINRYQPYGGGNGPIQLNNGSDFNFTFRVGVSDLMEDYKFVGGIRFGTDLSDKDIFLTFQNNRRRWDWGMTYYRSNVSNFYGSNFNTMLYTNLYQANVSYPFDEVNSIRAIVGLRSDRGVARTYDNNTGFPNPGVLKVPDTVTKFMISRLEFVHDNTINPTQNIWVGTRYKVYVDFNLPSSKTASNSDGKGTFNFGFDARHYHKISRYFIWAGRAAADFSWGGQKLIYYLGGVDGWISPKFNINPPAQDQSYAFQSLAVNMRGYNQNIANGNNSFVINSEFRLPVFTTFMSRPINNAFIRNFQLVQFVDLGTAWNGKYNGITRPSYIYRDPNNPTVVVRMDAGGLGPFAGGYGFGVRSTLLGYFLKLDTAWPMKGLFVGKPVWYFAMGFDF